MFYNSIKGIDTGTKENILEYLFGKSEKDQTGGLENNININLGYPGLAPGMQIGHVGGLLSSPTKPMSAGYPGFRPSVEKSEDLIHQFLQVGDIGLPSFPLGSATPDRKYSAEFVKLLQQIAADSKLSYDMKKKLFKTAYSLVAAPGTVSHQNMLGLRGNPKSYSVFRSSHSGRHHQVSER